MILVLSYKGHEQGTNPIIDWLIHLNADFQKVYMEDIVNRENNVLLNVDTGQLLIDGKDVLPKIKVVCYRRLYNDIYTSYFSNVNNKFKNQLINEFRREVKDIIEYLFHVTKDKVWLPKPHLNTVNKLIIHKEANSSGLIVPESIVTNSKIELLKFIDKLPGEVITKPINSSGYFVDDKYTYNSYSTTVTRNDIEAFPENFAPSLFQRKCDREYEVRTFYIDGEFYSVCAILKDEKFVDIKKSFRTENLMWVRYDLPNKIKTSVELFMRKIDMNTGSIDIIKEKDGKYTFIEVNPVGQYGSPSFIGNYVIEKVIAEWLIKHDKNHDGK